VFSFKYVFQNTNLVFSRVCVNAYRGLSEMSLVRVSSASPCDATCDCKPQRRTIQRRQRIFTSGFCCPVTGLMEVVLAGQSTSIDQRTSHFTCTDTWGAFLI